MYGESTHPMSLLTCPCCGDVLPIGDDVALLEIGKATPYTKENPECFIVDTQQEQFILHLSCFAEIIDEILEEREDVDPEDSEEPVLSCPSCRSLIGEEEYFFMGRPGLLEISKRAPQGKHVTRFKQMGPSKPICLLCFYPHIEQHFPQWTDLVEDLDMSMGDDEDEDELNTPF